MSYLGDFLFPPRRAQSPVRMLSGGERNRLLLARLFARPANVLVLDEPTNDLDLPTLGILENFLSEYPGCLLIVSHDRYFMDRLVDHLLVLEGDGAIRDFPGNYSLYRQSLKVQDTAEIVAKEPATPFPGPAPAPRRQLTYKEKREFEGLEQEIARLTLEKQEVTEKLNSGTVPFDQLQQLSFRIGEISQLLDGKELRWLELSEL
jgi:ATP-binding cassette subfamily F protein uup